MSCQLSIIGENLDIKDLLERMDIPGFIEFPKGFPISSVNSRKREVSFVTKTTSHASFTELKQQIIDTEIFLKKYFKNLKVISKTKGVDYAVLHFGLTHSISEDKLVHSFYLPIGIINLCSKLTLEIEVSMYADNMEEIIENRRLKKGKTLS